MTRPIKDILPSLLGNQDAWHIQLLRNWETIVGSIRTKVSLLRIHEDTLILGVSDSCWMQELYLLTPLLLQTINSHLDKPRIKNLRFKALGIEADKKRKITSSTTIKKAPILLNPGQEKALKALKDPELAKALKAYLEKCNE